MVEAGRVTVVIDSDTRKLNQGLRKARTDVSRFGFDIKKVAETAIGFGVANAAMVATRAVTSFVKESTMAAVEFEQRFASFSRLIEGDANYLLRQLDRAAGGTVSNLQLVTQTNNALLLGIQQEQLPQLLEASRILGAAVGRTTEQAFADLSMGIGRQSRLILDNLGIVVRAEEAYKAYAESVGKSTEELTVQEKQLAFNKAVMDGIEESVSRLDGSVTDATTSMQQFNKQWADFKVEAGELAIPVVTKALQGLNYELRNYMEQLSIIKGERGLTAQILQGIAPTGIKQLVPKMFPELEFGGIPGGLTAGNMLEQLRETDTTRYEEALLAARDVIQAEQEIQELINEKDLTQIKNLMELDTLQKQYDDRRRAGIDELGNSFLLVLEKIRDEAMSLDDDIRFGSKNQQSYAEFKSRRQEQIETGLLTPGGTL